MKLLRPSTRTRRFALALALGAALLPAPASASQAPAAAIPPAGIGPGAAPAGHAIAAAGAIVDLSALHVVARGDSLASIGARSGVSTRRVALENGLDPGKPLRPGQALQVTARHVVPPALEAGIVINPPQRMLFLFRAGRVAQAYPAAVGRPDWQTPLGEFTVANRQVDKTWIVSPSIQEEMRREGKPVLTQVPPGPDNPLGPRWIGLSMPAIGIHGTNAPSSVYGFRSHGCVRLHSDDVVRLFDAVAVGEPGRIVYLPVLLARGDDGRIWFEANPDVYRRSGATVATVRAMARDRGIAEESIDWSQVATMLRERDGLAREVGVREAEPGSRGEGERG